MNDMSTSNEVTVRLPAEQVAALARFSNRIGWNELRRFAYGEEEAVIMRAALERIRAIWAETGYPLR